MKLFASTQPVFCGLALAVLTGASGCATVETSLQTSWQKLTRVGQPAAVVVPVFSQAALPAAVQVPRGFQVGLETMGAGDITYQCRAKADSTPGTAWVLSKVDLKLSDLADAAVITYTGPPATFAHVDGSTVTATAVATAPSPAGNLPMQLFRVNPADKLGAMMGMTHIQRVDTVGGTPPNAPCEATVINTMAKVPFKAKYVFYRSL